MVTFIAKSVLSERDLSRVPFAASLAVQQAVRNLGAENAVLKWPNDVICDHCKLAGILVENLAVSVEKRACLIGIGVNVTQKDFPEANDYARKPISLRMILHEKTPSVEQLLNELCARLTDCFSQIASNDDWKNLAALWGALMTRNISQSGISEDGVRVEGIIRSLRLDDGAALIEEPSGNIVAARPII
jgi:BirA family biotin operon repressor/biotin-[acetyl-CoA-carboxylase] ligase